MRLKAGDRSFTVSEVPMDQDLTEHNFPLNKLDESKIEE